MPKNLIFRFDNLIFKEILILIPLYKEKNLISFLSPILGQYGVNVNNFINQLINFTKDYNKDLLLPVKVYILKNKECFFNIESLRVNFLMKNIILCLNIIDIYKISLIKSVFNYVFNKNITKIYFRNIFYYLNSYNLKISLK